MATEAHFKKEVIATPFFHLMSYQHLTAPGQPITVYIEGDGLAWLNRHEISSNPTPLTPLVLKLAIIDRSENVMYLARPCQYVPLNHDRLCHTSHYWTNLRYGKKVVVALDHALSHLKEKTGAPAFHLVGYSGGGGLAALLAAKRKDIASLRTLAGNLDPDAFARYHHVDQLEGSENPLKVAPLLVQLPQIHWVGADDHVVPPNLVRGFIAQIPPPNCATLKVLPHTNHHTGWEDEWVKIHGQIPACPFPR